MKNISVIVPIYNTEKYLRKCLDSLFNQTMNDDIEVILVNDGSTDNSINIIKEYALKYPKSVLVINQKNQGLSNARNSGMKIATGEYIFFVDSDDFLRKDTFELLLNKAEKNKYDIVVCDTMWINKKNKEIRKQLPLYLQSENTVQKQYIISMPTAWGKLVKRELLNKMQFKFMDGIIYEDLAIMPSLGVLTNKIGYVKEPVYCYILREGSIMSNNKYSDKLKDVFVALDNLENIFCKFEAKEKFIQELEFIYIEHLLRLAATRFLQYKEGKKEVDKIIDIMHEKFPNYQKNIYFRNWTTRSKIISNLIYNNHKFLAKAIANLKR